MRRVFGAVGVCAIALGAMGGSAAGKTINVHPGGHALTKAIQKAKAGDTLRVHEGHYREHVTIGKRLKLERADGEARPVVDAGCNANNTIYISSDGVTLEGLKVIGADEGFGSFPSEIFFDGPNTGRARDLVVHNSCGDAEYGINLFATGHVKVLDNKASGFTDSGVYVGGINNTHGGRLNVRGNELFGNNRGVIVEDTVFDADVRLAQNHIHDNTLSGLGPEDGVFLHNTDGIYIVKNSSKGNGGAGYHADPQSDDNVFASNTAHDNGDGALNDEGTDNCGASNSFSMPPC
jgi:nitrous oxidase accessory protein NosD